MEVRTFIYFIKLRSTGIIYFSTSSELEPHINFRKTHYIRWIISWSWVNPLSDATVLSMTSSVFFILKLSLQRYSPSKFISDRSPFYFPKRFYSWSSFRYSSDIILSRTLLVCLLSVKNRRFRVIIYFISITINQRCCISLFRRIYQMIFNHD